MKQALAFAGGALVGAMIAVLYAPESGEDLCSRLRTMLIKCGVVSPVSDNKYVRCRCVNLK